MPEFLTTYKIISNLEKLIIEARGEITIVCPYLKLSQNIFNRLSEADRRGITINFVYGKEDMNRDQKELINKLQSTNLYFSPKLHAKCYFNESELILTSMNLYEYSERDNLEMGILISVEGDNDLYADIREEVKTIVRNAKVVKKIKKNCYLLDDSLSESFIKYFKDKYLDHKIIFSLKGAPVDTVFVGAKMNEPPYYYINIDFDGRIEVDFKNESWDKREALHKEFKSELLNVKYRFYWDHFKNSPTVYKSEFIRDEWINMNNQQKFDYSAEALDLLLTEMKNAHARVMSTGKFL